MEKDLIKIRDKAIKKGWEDNKHSISKGRYVKAFSEPISIPSLYRIIKQRSAKTKPKNL